jgi:putative copper export protein
MGVARMQIIAIVHRLAIAFWVGGVAIFTFVLTPIIFRSNSRDTAGQIVGTLFPGYFRWGLACGTVALFSLLILRGKRFVPAAALLVLMLTLTAFQAFWIEPRAAALKREISFESMPKDHPLRREFSRLHAVSAVCNLTVFGGGVVLVILL